MLLHRCVFQVTKGTTEKCSAGAEPTVIHDCLDASSVFRVGDEHERQEIPGLGGDVVRE